MVEVKKDFGEPFWGEPPTGQPPPIQTYGYMVPLWWEVQDSMEYFDGWLDQHIVQVVQQGDRLPILEPLRDLLWGRRQYWLPCFIG